MRLISAEAWQKRCDELAQWHRWFAWKPVYVEGGDRVWFEAIDRRRERRYDVHEGEHYFEDFYRRPTRGRHNNG